MFRTVLKPTPSSNKISYDSRILTIGSCFADSIGNALARNKFNVLINPFGVVYNPLALFKQLDYCLDNSHPEESTYLKNQEIHYNYDYHSDLSALSRDELKFKIEGSIKTVQEALKKTNWLLITLGTAVGYVRNDTQALVANCHKVPSQNFERTFVSQKKIIKGFERTFKKLLRNNSSMRIILTVSPVRHLKETFDGNSISKSILRLVCHTIQEQHEGVEYFPAYEILLDDLRDYRFYSEDMLHPNELGERYIWEQFQKTYFDANTCDTIERWEPVLRSLAHRPFHSNTSSHHKFIENTIKKLEDFSDKFDVSKEIEKLQKQLA